MAPILLVVCRILHERAVGGEWGGGVLLATEHAPAHRRAVFGAFLQIGPPLGFVLAALVFSGTAAVSGADGFLAWGWRGPFLVRVGMVGVGLGGGLRVSRPPGFDEAASRDELVRAPLVEVIRRYPARVVVGLVTALGGLSTWFLITTYSVSYGPTPLGIPPGPMALVACAAA